MNHQLGTRSTGDFYQRPLGVGVTGLTLSGNKQKAFGRRARVRLSGPHGPTRSVAARASLVSRWKALFLRSLPGSFSSALSNVDMDRSQSLFSIAHTAF